MGNLEFVVLVVAMGGVHAMPFRSWREGVVSYL